MSSVGQQQPCTVLFLVLLLGACSTPRAGGLVGNPEALEAGHYVDRSRVLVQAVQLADLSSIVLAEIDTSRVSDQDGVSTQEGAAALRFGLTGSSTELDVLNLGRSGAAARLDVAIVEMSTGSAVARVFAGELGAGHAWVQVDARLVDPRSGQVLAELCDRRRGSGAIGFRDGFGDSDAGPAMVREMLEDAGRDIRRELQELLNTG